MKNDIEHINYQQSAMLERLLLDFGNLLHHSLVEATREDETMALSELIGEFTLLASAYATKTDRLREDLGVSLNEAALLKLTAIKTGNTHDNEWRRFAEDAKRTLLAQNL